METINQTVEQTLPAVIAVELPEASPAANADAEATAKVLEGLAVITTELRAIRDTGIKVSEHCAKALAFAAKMAGPGNSKQFRKILDDCERAILNESKVEHWKDLGPEARSYLAYKTQFTQWISEVKSSIPEGVEPVTLRLQVSRWYANRPQVAVSAKKGGATKGKDGKDAAPVVVTDSTDPATGEKMGVTLGMTRATIKVRGKDGKYVDETVNFPTAVTGGLSRLLRQIAGKLHDDSASPDSIAEIVAVLKDAHDMLAPSKK